jgi:orotidine-5'-phosphate decarboxylase
MTASEKLKKKNDESKFICVGLDTDLEKVPLHLQSSKNPILEFNKKIIEATSEYTGAYKINFAFYERLGSKGFDILLQTKEFIPKDILTIADAKRGDIGNTSKYYADAVFNYFGFDSITVNPYMGEDSVKPFLEYENKLIFIFALTSNPGADDFEKLQLKDESFLFQKVIEKVKDWNDKNNCGIVFGATKLQELQENISSFGNLPVLLPGVGAQGGNLEEVMKLFIKNKKLNLLINISRGIIYKDNAANFAISAKGEIISLNEKVNKLLSK